KRPAPVEPRHVALGLHREQVQTVDQLAELTQRVAAGQRCDRAGRLQGDLVLGVVDDVLPDPLQAAAAQVNHGAQALKAAGDFGLQSRQLISVDLQGKAGQQVK